MGNSVIRVMNCGLDETLMSQKTCRSKKAEHLKAWNSSPRAAPRAEVAPAIRSRDTCMATQFNVQPVAGAPESEGSSSKIARALIEIG